MRRNLLGGILVLAMAAVTAGEVAAQETGTPVFKAPYRAFDTNEFGGTISFPEGLDFGLEGFYTYGSGTNDFGLRAGLARQGDADFTRYAIGGNFRTRVLNYSQSFPLDGALTVGAGYLFGDGEDFFTIPLGVTLGRRLELEGSSTTFTPYVHPVIVPQFGGGDSDVGFALGLGVDIAFAQNLSIRVNAGVGDIEGVAFSLAFVQ